MQLNRSQAHGGQWPESDEEEEPLYRTDEFRMKLMKVLMCSKKYCHDWTRCPFAHPGEKATRRDPLLGVYTGIACPDMKKEQQCPRGHYCPYAHNVFEYWLHPTRYRTALCRDVDRCTRKICFFAHEASEIRTNVERPYVSPEQLAAATEMAAADPRVQADYSSHADSQRRMSSKASLLSNTYAGPEESAEGDQSQDPYYGLTMTLRPPPPNEESQEMSQALSSLMRGSMGPISNPYVGPSTPWLPQRGLSDHLQTMPVPPDAAGMVAGLDGLPALDQRIRRIASDPTSRHPQRHGSLRGADADLLRQGSAALSTQAIDELAPSGFPGHLNTLPHTLSHQSRGSQQNLANATAHLMGDPAAKGQSIWSTPVSPLDQLYSTASLSSERQSSLEAQSPMALEVAYRQKLQKRIMARRRDIGGPTAYRNGWAGLTPGIPHPGAYGPQQSAQDLHAAQHAYPNWTLNPNLEFTQAIQREYLRQQQQQQQQAVFEQMEMARQLHQAMQAEQSGQGCAQPLKLARRPSSENETGFDLRFGGLGEAQGLLSQTHTGLHGAAHPSLLSTTAGMFAVDPRAPQSAALFESQLRQIAQPSEARARPASEQTSIGDERSRPPTRGARRPSSHSGVDALEARLAGLELEGRDATPAGSTAANV